MSEQAAASPVPLRPTFRHLLRLHLFTTTGLQLAVTTTYALAELFLLGMDPLVSLRARLIVITVAFLGLGPVYTYLRTVSKRVFRIRDGETPNRVIAVHDLLYVVAFNLFLGPWLYFFAGGTDWEIITGTVLALTIGLVNGPLNGLMIDLAGELTGVRPSARFPPALRDRPARTKQLLFIGIVIATITFLAAIYAWQLSG